MADSSEIEEQVDLDEDNYLEDDEPEEQSYEDGLGGANDEHSDDDADENVVPRSRDEEEEPIHEAYGSDTQEKTVEDGGGMRRLQMKEIKRFSLEGLPREILEEEIRELCEPIGDIFEVRQVSIKGTFIPVQVLEHLVRRVTAC